jgi:hypothetical protein
MPRPLNVQSWRCAYVVVHFDDTWTSNLWAPLWLRQLLLLCGVSWHALFFFKWSSHVIFCYQTTQLEQWFSYLMTSVCAYASVFWTASTTYIVYFFLFCFFPFSFFFFVVVSLRDIDTTQEPSNGSHTAPLTPNIKFSLDSLLAKQPPAATYSFPGSLLCHFDTFSHPSIAWCTGPIATTQREQ